MFAYRYCQTTGSRYIYLFNNVWFYSLGYFVVVLLIFVFVVMPLNMQMMFTQESGAAFRDDPKIFKLLENEPLVFVMDVSFFSLNKRIRFDFTCTRVKFSICVPGM
jgi:hypothetical protein